MRDALGKQGWDVFFCDHARPEFDSSSDLNLLHEIGLDLPFLIVSGAIGEDISVPAIRSGAHDFLLKRNRHRLGAAVEREIREVGVRRQSKEATKAGRAHHRELEDSNKQARGQPERVRSLEQVFG